MKEPCVSLDGLQVQKACSVGGARCCPWEFIVPDGGPPVPRQLLSTEGRLGSFFFLMRACLAAAAAIVWDLSS